MNVVVLVTFEFIFISDLLCIIMGICEYLGALEKSRSLFICMDRVYGG